MGTSRPAPVILSSGWAKNHIREAWVQGAPCTPHPAGGDILKALGLDYGERRIGTALSDALGSMAFPRGVIQHTTLEEDLAAILRLAQEEGVERIVVGLPRSLDGTLQQQARRVEAFCEALRQRSKVPVETWDERFSTFEAEHSLREAGVKPAQERGRVDAAAAAIILQRWLDQRGAKSRL